MRAILLDPIRQTIEVADVGSEARAIRGLLSAQLHLKAIFPNGDRLLSASDLNGAFSIGGSKPMTGAAVLVGRRLPFGEYAPARTSLQDVRALVRWSQPELRDPA
ncbi:hypothetical protein ACQR1I_09240 [Bradyrhizobium sp. HKCCYLS2038]|uniref:hypothetical protein n=1 Tax=unclassified Bradyrhizobium TaxID=2631580 RepID=UPI003EC0F040